METRGTSREGTASQALREPSQVRNVPHTPSPSRQPDGNPNKGGSAPTHRGAAAATTVGDSPSRRHRTFNGEPPKSTIPTCPKSGDFPRPPRLPPLAPSAPRARLPPQGCGAAGPRGRAPPQPARRSRSPQGAQTSSRSSAGTCRASPQSPLRRRTTTTPEPACRATQVPCAPPAPGPLTKRAGRDASFWRPSGHGAPPHPSAPSSGHTVPSLGDTASTRLPCGSFSRLSPHDTVIPLSYPGSPPLPGLFPSGPPAPPPLPHSSSPHPPP